MTFFYTLSLFRSFFVSSDPVSKWGGDTMPEREKKPSWNDWHSRQTDIFKLHVWIRTRTVTLPNWNRRRCLPKGLWDPHLHGTKRLRYGWRSTLVWRRKARHQIKDSVWGSLYWVFCLYYFTSGKPNPFKTQHLVLVKVKSTIFTLGY